MRVSAALVKIMHDETTTEVLADIWHLARIDPREFRCLPQDGRSAREVSKKILTRTSIVVLGFPFQEEKSLLVLLSILSSKKI